MRDYQSFEVRNVSVIGHSGAGKTSVLEAMLYYTKATDRFGKTTEGSSMIDFDTAAKVVVAIANIATAKIIIFFIIFLPFFTLRAIF